MMESSPGRRAYDRAYDAQIDGDIGLPSVPYDRLGRRDRDAWEAIAAAGASDLAFTVSELVLLLDAIMVHYRHVAAIPENDPSNLPPLEALQHKIEALVKTVTPKGDHYSALLHSLSQAQRANAFELRDAITRALEADMTWRDIGDQLDADHTTIYRQYRASSPIVVVKAYHTK